MIRVLSNRKMIYIMLLVLFCVFASAGLIFASTSSIIGASLLLVLGSSLVVRYWVVIGRAITLTSEGLHIQFLGYSRLYNWDTIQHIKFFHCGAECLGYKAYDVSGIEFSLTKAIRPYWLMPAEYSMIAHPWSYVFVYFQPQDGINANAPYPSLYETNEENLRKKMDEWGILP